VFLPNLVVKNKEMITQKYVNQIAYRIVGCAINVHKAFGPGLLESVYEECLIEELKINDLTVSYQQKVPLFYRGKQLKTDLRLDIIVNDLIIVELKAVDIMIPIYKAQLLSYLKLSGKPKGLLINFNSEILKEQIIPLVTEEFSKLPKE
jgi:GxxExxY protein